MRRTWDERIQRELIGLLFNIVRCNAVFFVKEVEPQSSKEMQEDVQSSISYSGGKKLVDIRKVNYVILGGDNAGEHLLM